MDLASCTGLLLDLDGTLVDTEPIHCEVHQELLSRYGIEISVEDIYANIGAGDQAFYAGLMRAHGVEADPLAWCEEKDRRMLERYRAGGLRVQPGVEPLLDAAAAARIPCCVVTSSRRDMASLALAGAGIAERLPDCVCWGDTDEHKPDPAPYHLGLRTIGRADEPQGVLAIEDSVPGVRAAVAAGCTVVGVSHLVGADLLRAAGAQRVLTDLADLL